jgi:glycosyltransferase involved in cell wall biosynthesis
MSTPELAVVIASVNGLPYVDDCLASLAQHAPDAEVIVADSTDERTRSVLAKRWPDVKLLSFDTPRTVPELRAAGIFAATAPYVAVIEDHCLVTEGWAESILRAHRGGVSVVGGPVRNVALRIRDWAAFLFEYSAHMEPAPAGAAADLTGMNVSYDARALGAIDDLLREGKWEGWLHGRLLSRGFALYREPKAVIEHAKDFGVREFCSQRFHYARAHAAMRNPDMGRLKRAVYVVASPLIAPLLLTRIARNVLQRRARIREFVLALPLLLVYCAVTAFGEAPGYVRGDRGSLLKVR